MSLPRLGVPGGENFAGRRVPQNPFKRGIPAAPEIGSHAHPIEMHVHAQSGGRRMVSQAALLRAHLAERSNPRPRIRAVPASGDIPTTAVLRSPDRRSGSHGRRSRRAIRSAPASRRSEWALKRSSELAEAFADGCCFRNGSDRRCLPSLLLDRLIRPQRVRANRTAALSNASKP